MIKLGYRKDPTDARDWTFDALVPLLAKRTSTGTHVIPTNVPIHDQGGLRSCVANATCEALEILEEAYEPLSRLFVYWNARRANGDECLDEGTYVRSAFASLAELGVCLEKAWTYDESKYAERPTLAAYEFAYDHKIKGFYRIPTRGDALLDDLEHAIRADHPVAFGTQVGKPFTEYDGSPLVWLPPTRPIGGHAMVIDGVRIGNDKRREWRLRNSWGAGWGDHGFAWADSAWITDPWSDDFWVATTLGPSGAELKAARKA